MNCKLTYFILILSNLIQCNTFNKDINEDFDQWYNKEIRLPKLINVLDNSHMLNSGCYKFVSHIDSDCGICLSEMKNWMHYSKDINDKYKIDFIFYVNGSNFDNILSSIEMDSICNFIIYFDKDDKYMRINNIPHDPRFSTFLLNGDNKIKIIGTPFKNNEMIKLYQDFFRTTL